MDENDLPITTTLPVPSFFWMKPSYAKEFITVTVEPYATQFHDLLDEVNDIIGADWTSYPPYVPPADSFTPTKRMQARLDLLDQLLARAWQTVPNPDYDPVKAAEWEAARQANDAVIVTVAQSYTEREP